MIIVFSVDMTSGSEQMYLHNGGYVLSPEMHSGIATNASPFVCIQGNTVMLSVPNALDVLRRYRDTESTHRLYFFTHVKPLEDP